MYVSFTSKVLNTNRRGCKLKDPWTKDIVLSMLPLVKKNTLEQKVQAQGSLQNTVNHLFLDFDDESIPDGIAGQICQENGSTKIDNQV